MCTVLLPSGVNPIAVNKYIYLIGRVKRYSTITVLFKHDSGSLVLLYIDTYILDCVHIWGGVFLPPEPVKFYNVGDNG